MASQEKNKAGNTSACLSVFFFFSQFLRFLLLYQMVGGKKPHCFHGNMKNVFCNVTVVVPNEVLN